MDHSLNDVVFDRLQLRSFTTRVFEYFDVLPKDAALAADVLA
jgi:hypothetical protein